MTELLAVHETWLRRTTWVLAGIVGLPSLVVGWLFLIAIPLTLITVSLGLLAGRSPFWNGVWLRVFAGCGAIIVVWGLIETSRDGSIIATVAWLGSVACALAATYKVGNLVRVRLLDPRS